MNVRAYIEDQDYETIITFLQEEEWKSFYEAKKDLYKEALKNSETFICEEDGKILGYMRVISDFTYTTYVTELLVRKEYRGSGVGRLLMEKAERLAPYGTTDVISDSNDFYENLGYQVVGGGLRKCSTK